MGSACGTRGKIYVCRGLEYFIGFQNAPPICV